MKRSYFDAEKIEVDYETLKNCLGHAVADKMENIEGYLRKMHDRDDTHMAFDARRLAEEAEVLQYVADLYHAVCEAESRETFIVTGIKEGEHETDDERD